MLNILLISKDKVEVLHYFLEYISELDTTVLSELAIYVVSKLIVTFCFKASKVLTAE